MEKRDDFFIPEEVAEWIGLKKSELLALLVQKIEPDDFSFEDYFQFDRFLPETIESPDSIFESADDDKKLRTYVKTYSEQFEFHQVIIGLMMEEATSSVFIPIISFVSKKKDLVREFSSGKSLSRPILN